MDPNKVSVVQTQLFLEEMGSGADKFLDLLTVKERRVMTARWISRPENTYGFMVVGASARRVINDNNRWFAYMSQALRPIIRLDMFRSRTYDTFHDYVAHEGGAAAEWIDSLPMFCELEPLSHYDPEEFRGQLWRLARLDENLT